MFRALLIFTFALLASCGSSLDDRVDELVAAKNIWMSVSNERTYSYTLRIHGTPAYTVSVSNPETLRENWLEERTCSEPGVCRLEPTILELFQWILDLNGRVVREGIRLDVTYDRSMGYPKLIAWDDRSSNHSAVVIRVSDVVFDE